MARFTKSDMGYTDYSWTVLNNDNSKITGEPDSTLLNRREGYEMLYFINKFAEIHHDDAHSIGKKLERIIREKVPAHLHSQQHIKDWIKANWSTL
jgi:hypothetical protein